jgi:hypothetical protein
MEFKFGEKNGATTFSITTLSMTTLSITIKSTLCNVNVMLSVVF